MESITTSGLEEAIKVAVTTVLVPEDESQASLAYDPNCVEGWIARIIDLTTEALIAKFGGERNKFVVHVVICENQGVGLHVNTGCRWNIGRDCYAMVPWASGSLYAITTAYAIYVEGPPSVICSTN